MGIFARLRAKAAESAIDFALNAFWASVTGAIVTSLIATYLATSALPAKWFYEVIGAFWAFIAVIAITSGIVFWRHRLKAKPTAILGRKGFLNFKVEGARAMTRLGRHTVGITRETQSIGAIANAGALELQKINASRQNVDERALRSAKRTAGKLRRHVTRMEVHAESFAFSADEMIRNITAWFKWADEHGATAQLRSIIPVLMSLRQNMEGARGSTEGFRKSAEAIRNVSDDTDEVNGLLVAVLDTIIAKQREIEAFCAESIRVLGGAS